MDGFIDPTRQQFGAMMKLPSDGPVHMLNMLRFRDRAAYPPDHPNAGDGRTGAEAYRAYGEDSGPIFRRVGGRIAHAWTPELTVIGPDEPRWDAVFIAEYPSAAAFGEMVKDPDYQRAVIHRQAAVADSRLMRLKPRPTGAGFAG